MHSRWSTVKYSYAPNSRRSYVSHWESSAYPKPETQEHPLLSTREVAGWKWAGWASRPIAVGSCVAG